MKRYILTAILLLIAIPAWGLDVKVPCLNLPSTDTVQFYQYDIDDANLDLNWISTSVSEVANGDSTSTYYKTLTFDAGHNYIVNCRTTVVSPTQYAKGAFTALETSVDALISTRSSHSAADVKTAIEAAGSSIATLRDYLSKMTVATGEADWQFDSVALALGPTETIPLQDVRDAMKLAPSAGDSALNSIDERLSALYDPLFGLEMIEEKLDNEVAAPIANVTYGLSALQVILDAIATSTEVQAMIDVLKGDGWTNETLKSIKDAIGSGGISAQQVRDALKLAPSAGDPAAGSIDKKLNNIERHN